MQVLLAHLYDLYSIYSLGNDLPPRHQLGQTLSNLQFILENEPNFPNCTKYWVLNRIVDNTIEASIIELLKNYGYKLEESVFRIPFDVEEYVKIDFKLDALSDPDFFRTEAFLKSSYGARQIFLESLYHDKNRYVMNNVGPWVHSS